MRRGRLGHFLAAGMWTSIAVETVQRDFVAGSVGIRVLDSTLAAGVGFFLILPCLRFGFATPKPISILEGFRRGAWTDEGLRQSVNEFLAPEERIGAATLGTTGTGFRARPVYLGLTDTRLVGLRGYPPFLIPLKIDFSEPRANMRVISQRARGSRWEIVMGRGDTPPERYLFRRRFTVQARLIAEVHSSSDSASTTRN